MTSEERMISIPADLIPRLVKKIVFWRRSTSPIESGIRIKSRKEIAVGGTSIVYLVNYTNGAQEVEKMLLPKFQFRIHQYEQVHDWNKSNQNICF